MFTEFETTPSLKLNARGKEGPCFYSCTSLKRLKYFPVQVLPVWVYI